MGNDHGTAGEVLQTLLQRTQSVHIDVVGRFVQQQHIGLAAERQRQVHPVALAAGKHTRLLALVGAGKVEARHIGAGIDGTAADHQLVVAFGNHLPDTLLRVDLRVLLINIAQFHSLTDLESAAVRFFQPHYHTEERGFAAAVRPDNTHNAGGRQRKVKVLIQQLVAECL